MGQYKNESKEQYNERMRKYMNQYVKDNIGIMRPRWRKQYEELKRKVFEYLGGAKCVRCGCNAYELLELNHKNLGGRKEWRETGMRGMNQLRRDILKRKRKDEFEVLCKPCNSIHYAESKFGVKYEIKWIPK